VNWSADGGLALVQLIKYSLYSDSGVARIWCKGCKLHEILLLLSHEMMRSDTLSNVHVAATELPQLLSQNTNIIGEATAQSH